MAKSKTGVNENDNMRKILSPKFESNKEGLLSVLEKAKSARG